MKVSVPWLNTYFEKPLSSNVDTLVEALTFHAFEVEEVVGEKGKETLEVKVLPDRAAYALSHRGIARELAAVLSVSMQKDPLREALPEFSATDALIVSVEDQAACPRYIGALITGVKVGPSPAWLQDALHAVGQRSINNIVDATNYVMLDIGQPLHAFDAGKLDRRDGTYAIGVRAAKEGETMTTLSGEEYALPEGTLVISDAHADVAIGIAGVKGGKAAELTDATTDIVLESANFDPTLVRRASQKLKLFTDASLRFQNRPSPLLAGYGMQAVIALIQELAGGELAGVVDVATALPQDRLAPVSVSLEEVNRVLGSAFDGSDVANVFDRLGFPFVEEGGRFIVTPPFERRDLNLSEDLIEEVGRIIGYDKVPSQPLPPLQGVPTQARYRGIERVRDFLVERGFAEVSSQSFASEGDVSLANPLQSEKPFLRPSLLPNLREARERAVQFAPRVLGPDADFVKLFEIGTVFSADGESTLVGLAAAPLSGKLPNDVVKEHIATLEQELFNDRIGARYSLEGDMAELSLSKVDLEKLGADYTPASVHLGAYRSFSMYPFALRDIAVWTPAGTEESEVATAILKEAGDLLARLDEFDRFEKDGRISYAFRLVFEASDRTLSDADLNPILERVTSSLNAREGWQVR